MIFSEACNNSKRYWEKISFPEKDASERIHKNIHKRYFFPEFEIGGKNQLYTGSYLHTPSQTYN
jgi:hypothetical protein